MLSFTVNLPYCERTENGLENECGPTGPQWAAMSCELQARACKSQRCQLSPDLTVTWQGSCSPLDLPRLALVMPLISGRGRVKSLCLSHRPLSLIHLHPQELLEY